MYELKKMERYLRVNLLGPGPRLMKKEFTEPRSHKGWETLLVHTALVKPITNKLKQTNKTIHVAKPEYVT